MSLLQSKAARRVATGVAAVALVLAAAVPGTVFGESVTLHRSCDATGASTVGCTNAVQVANRSASQSATQSSTVDDSATNDLSNNSTISADPRNSLTSSDSHDQTQSLDLSGGTQSNRVDVDQDVSARASVPTSGGRASACSRVNRSRPILRAIRSSSGASTTITPFIHRWSPFSISSGAS